MKRGRSHKGRAGGDATRKPSGRGTVPKNPAKTGHLQSAATDHPSTRATKAGSTDGRPEPEGFPVVGIGASAGRLEAWEEFFQHMSTDSGQPDLMNE